MNQDKDDSLPEIETEKDHAKVQDVVKRHHGQFNPAAFDFFTDQVVDAGALQIYAYQHE